MVANLHFQLSCLHLITCYTLPLTQHHSLFRDLVPLLKQWLEFMFVGVDVFGPNSARVKMTLKGIKTYLCPRTCCKLYYYYTSWQVWSNYKLKKMSTTQCKQSYACASRLNDILACQNLYCGSQNVPQHAT